MLVYGYSNYAGVLHIYATYSDAFNAWANDGNAGISSMPTESGMRIEDHRTPQTQPRRSARPPAPGSFAEFVSLGQ